LQATTGYELYLNRKDAGPITPTRRIGGAFNAELDFTFFANKAQENAAAAAVYQAAMGIQTALDVLSNDQSFKGFLKTMSHDVIKSTQEWPRVETVVGILGGSPTSALDRLTLGYGLWGNVPVESKFERKQVTYLAQNRQKYIELLEKAANYLKSKNNTVRLWSTNNIPRDGIAAYVTFTPLIDPFYHLATVTKPGQGQYLITGRYINLTPLFWKLPLGNPSAGFPSSHLSNQTGVMIHELGRWINGLYFDGGQIHLLGTPAWENVDAWDEIISALNWYAKNGKL
jgi:hypothetical protein